jgi:hypothetical protein
VGEGAAGGGIGSGGGGGVCWSESLTPKNRTSALSAAASSLSWSWREPIALAMSARRARTSSKLGFLIEDAMIPYLYHGLNVAPIQNQSYGTNQSNLRIDF